MKFKIGFDGYSKEKEYPVDNRIITEEKAPVKSLVQVQFPNRGRSLAYYNDRFDLHVGDLVFVDGKLEGERGIVTDVSYAFKIKLSDYKRVIAVADTTVKGELCFGGSHLVSFVRSVIPYDKIRGWFLPPADDEEYAVGSDDRGFLLEKLDEFDIQPQIADRGFDYYNHNKVVYLCLDGIHGKAIVEGSAPYELTFDYQNGEVSNLICDCFCSFHCKHEFALLLQLRETLKIIEKQYEDLYEQSDYFAAICKATLFNYAMNTDKSGSIVLG